MNSKTLIKKILLAFEQSSTTIKYKEVYVYEDGPNDIKQVTLSFGVTEYGNLKKLLESYCSHDTPVSDLIEPYLPKIGKSALAADKQFINLLKQAGDDQVMKDCQEEAYDQMYITPAYSWCDKNGFVTPLSHLVICDSFLHSGSILSVLRNSFPESVPVSGGDEKTWIKLYCEARRKWLANHSRKDLHSTVYRMDLMLALIKANDWNLSNNKYIANDVTIV